ncbi:PREDICTED: dolichyl-phosphate-mannose--protein mannosyltransferase 4 [Papilio xuthus]|uniref:Protein O-mannosyltransferase 1 n=1 Tax=Papilio xuthus TaxID=66420 RepID=A0AAJ7E9S8_PAPXU|nr:PREDICTED: dolichyl-phosphate-mannose--protein mannosyltransferase 4 [Papilio xuthus]
MDIDKSVRKRKDKKKSIEVNELGEKFLKESPELASREVVDGTITENDIESSSLFTAASSKSSQKSPKGFYLKFEIDVVFLLLLGLALWTRTYNLEEPRYIVFDELHYGRYVSLYTKGIFFFDAHPPLGKQLLYLAGRLGGYNGNFTFDRIGSPYTESVPIRALRMVPAISGSLLVGITYQLMLEISTYQWTAILAALLVLFENCFLTQSRFMLLESILLLFGLCGIYCVIKSTTKTGTSSVLWLCVGAISLGCCFSIKYSGIYTYYLALFLVGRQMWQRISSTESTFRIALSIIWRSFVLVTIPLIVYIGVFYAHLAMLPKAGPHDSVMTSAFQASLQGGLASITRGQPLHVSHGSQITLRHSHGRTCWLHSHAHVYPVRYTDGRGSSHQQQVTCYSFKDVNNWWIVKRPDQASLAVTNPPDAIRHGDVVQLLHGITSRALNSHDVAAPVSPQSQEVSCYIDYNVSMSAQNLWRVEIVNRDNEDATWDSIRSLVRLIHVDSGSALRFSGRQLPSWGFHQHEVVADKVVTHQDTIWNVEEHRYTKAEDRRERERELVSAEMIPTAVTQLSFWAKFMELQYKMIAHAPDAPSGHMFASEPTEWPVLSRSIAYWLSPHSNAQIHLIGNIVTWYAGTLSVLLYSAFLALYAIRQRRLCEDLPLQSSHQFYNAGCILFFGYWLHYLPYFFVDRTLFLHHYLPAYMFKILLLAYVIDHVYFVLQLREKTRALNNVFIIGITVWLAYVLLTFIKFSVLSYGNTDLNENDLMNLRWKDTWDFILHKRG